MCYHAAPADVNLILRALSVDGEAIWNVKESFEDLLMFSDTLFSLFPARVGLLPEALDL